MSSELLKALAAPLAVEDHEFINGLVYLSEEAVANRLDAVCPEWTWELVGDPVARGGVIAQRGRLTVGGIYRDGVGMAAAVTSKDGSREVNEPEKSAATDAFKRAARMFGVGRYLLRTPQSVRDYDTLARWLNGAKPQPQPAQKKNDPPPSEERFYADTVNIKTHGDKRYYVFTGEGGKSASTLDATLAGKAGQIVTLAPAGGQIAIAVTVTAALETKPDGGKFWKVVSIEQAAAPEPAGAAVPF